MVVWFSIQRLSNLPSFRVFARGAYSKMGPSPRKPATVKNPVRLVFILVFPICAWGLHQTPGRHRAGENCPGRLQSRPNRSRV